MIFEIEPHKKNPIVGKTQCIEFAFSSKTKTHLDSHVKKQAYIILSCRSKKNNKNINNIVFGWRKDGFSAMVYVY